MPAGVFIEAYIFAAGNGRVKADLSANAGSCDGLAG
jgi:hypothetical protein